MGIKEAEEATGISRQNIRFYERQGLLHPARNKNNSYREYTEEDILRLKEIRLLRKLGMPVEEIRRLLDGETQLQPALAEQERRLEAEAEKLKACCRFCRKIHESSLKEMDVDQYLSQMEEEEKNGAVFAKFIEDYKNVTISEARRSFDFKPDTMCMTPEEFTMELCKYAEQNHLDLVITKEGLLPEFTIDGIEYTASRSFGRFGATVHCVMKHPEDYMPPEMSEKRYKRIRRICQICNLCLLLVIDICMILAGEGIWLPLVLCLPAAVVYIGVQIRWVQKKNDKYRDS